MFVPVTSTANYWNYIAIKSRLSRGSYTAFIMQYIFHFVPIFRHIPLAESLVMWPPIEVCLYISKTMCLYVFQKEGRNNMKWLFLTVSHALLNFLFRYLSLLTDVINNIIRTRTRNSSIYSVGRNYLKKSDFKCKKYAI